MEKNDKENLTALSDDELDGICGGFGVMTLEKVTPDRTENMVVKGFSEKRKRCKGGLRTLENGKDDRGQKYGTMKL